MNSYEFLTGGTELVQSTQQLYHDFARENGISYNTLAVLYTCRISGGCTQKRIAAEWQLPKQTVNSVCKELLQKGLISKQKSTGDRRETKISLTKEGETVTAPVVEKLLQIEDGILSRLGQEKAAHFLKIYTEIKDIMVSEFNKRR